MNTKIYLWRIGFFFLILPMFLFIASCKPTQPKEPQINFVTEYKAPIPEKVDIYSFKPMTVTKEDFLKQCEMLELGKKGKTVESDLGIVYKTTYATLLVSPKTGTTIFTDSVKSSAVVPGKYPVMSENAVRAMATNFVVKIFGLKEGEFKYVKTQHLHNAIQGPNQKPEETIDESIAVFARMINGVEVIGDGGFIRIHFDNQGNLTQYQSVWRNWQVSEKGTKVLPYLQVKEKFLKNLKSQFKGSETINVLDVKFGYFERGLLQEQNYLQPAFAFKVVYIDPETKQSSGARVVIMPAIEKVFEPLVIQNDFSTREPKRQK